MMDYENRFKLPGIEEQYSLTAAIILDKMIAKKRPFSTLLEGDDTFLEETIDFLVKNQVLDTDVEKAEYIPSVRGKKVYKNFIDKYQEYVRLYDVFCAVDLEEGCFAFEKIFDYSDDIFMDYINDERFVDLRVTVAELKEMNPFEIVFISFLMEKRFREPKDRVNNTMGKESWQYICTSGQIFEEIQEICNNAPNYEELGFEDEEGIVSGEDVIRDVIKQGVELARKINEHQKKVDERAQEVLDEEEEPEIITTTVYEDGGWYDPYWHDPYYHSPLWDVALIGLILL